MFDDLLQVRSCGVNFYVLRDSDGLYLIDGGFIGGRSDLFRALRVKGWDGDSIVGIILTHGHLDHVLNVGGLAEGSGAWIAAPRLDAAHYEGSPVYHGAARFTGCLESLGRATLGFRPFTPDRLLDDGDTLDVWQGLAVVRLPGHTAGHSGFYCRERKLLFCGDLFASYGRWSHLPPRIFNSESGRIPESMLKALALDLIGVLPNHCDRSPPGNHLARLQELSRKHKRAKPDPGS